MQNINLGEKLQNLRRYKGLSQKEFAEFLDIPQPSMSAYENGRNSPTMDVLINIAQKCNVSLDWLCGLTSSPHNISSLGDVADFLYMLYEIKEIGFEIEVHDHLFNDIETENDKYYARITVFGNDPRYEMNSSLCQIINDVKNDFTDLESYTISKEFYDLAKEKRKQYYSLPLTKKQFPTLSREDQLKKRLEYMKSLENK